MPGDTVLGVDLRLVGRESGCAGRLLAPVEDVMSSLVLHTVRHEKLWVAIQSELPLHDLAHDALHVQRVYRWALRLASEAEADVDLVGAAALVHDLVNVPKESSERQMASRLSADAATPKLEGAGYDSEEIVLIREAVGRCSWSRGLAPENALQRVLQDADRLDAIGALGIARTFSTAQAMASRGHALRLYDEDDPMARERAVDDRRFALDHFKAKLLELAAGMHLPAAQKEAEQRQKAMLTFLEQLGAEL